MQQGCRFVRRKSIVTTCSRHVEEIGLGKSPEVSFFHAKTTWARNGGLYFGEVDFEAISGTVAVALVEFGLLHVV